MVQYNRMIDDVGKGRAVVRTFTAQLAMVNGMVTALIAAPPFPFRVKRVMTGSSVATDITGVFDVMVLAPDTDLDTAPAVGNRIIAAQAAFADKKMHDRTLVGGATGVADQKQAAGSLVVAQLNHNAILGTGLINVLVELDAVGTPFGAYDGQSDSEGAYG